MFRPFALPALAVLLWCVARAPNAPPTYELPLEVRAEDARDPGPDPGTCPLGPREDAFPELDRLDHLATTEAIEREWFDEPRPVPLVPRDPLFLEWEPDGCVRYGLTTRGAPNCPRRSAAKTASCTAVGNPRAGSARGSGGSAQPRSTC